MSSSSCSCRVCGGSGWVVRTPPGGVPRYDSGGLSIVLPHVTTWEQCAECVARLQPRCAIIPIPSSAHPFQSEAPTP